MRYRKLGRTGLKVSEIGFGAWAIGGTSEVLGVNWGWGEIDERDAIEAVRAALDCGVNFFDTADVYGQGRSEETLGKALGQDWQRALVASKFGNTVKDDQFAKDWSRDYIIQSVEGSLRRLKKETIDLYQLHNPDVEAILNGDWPETMERLREQGKIRYYGVSVFLPEEALAVMQRNVGDVLQVGYNALRLEMVNEVFPRAQEANYGIIARVALYYGVLAGKFTAATRFAANDHRSHTLAPEMIAELAPRAERLKPLAEKEGKGSFARWALRFAISHPAVSTVIPGARNAEQARENCAASDLGEIPPEQFAEAYSRWKQDPWLSALRVGL